MSKTTVINFDDLAEDTAVSNGYNGLNWTNFTVSNPVDDGVTSSGYGTGVTSGTQDAYTNWAHTASISLDNYETFTFKGVELTSAWNSSEKIEVDAYDVQGNLVHKKVLTISDTGPTDFHANWKGVAEVEFRPLSGTTDPNVVGSGNHIVIDDLAVADVGSNAPDAHVSAAAAWAGGGMGLHSHEAFA